MMRWLVLILLFTAPMLAGCGTPQEPKIITKTVNVEVAVPCIDKAKLPARPALMTLEQIRAALAAAPLFDDRMKIIVAQLRLYSGWTPVIEGALAGCATVPSP